MRKNGGAWIEAAIVIAGIALLVYSGLVNKAELAGEKWTQLALSQVAAHIVVYFRRLNFRNETILRVGFAVAVALAG